MFMLRHIIIMFSFIEARVWLYKGNGFCAKTTIIFKRKIPLYFLNHQDRVYDSVLMNSILFFFTTIITILMFFFDYCIFRHTFAHACNNENHEECRFVPIVDCMYLYNDFLQRPEALAGESGSRWQHGWRETRLCPHHTWQSWKAFGRFLQTNRDALASAEAQGAKQVRHGLSFRVKQV